jgi:hypothetical protein
VSSGRVGTKAACQCVSSAPLLVSFLARWTYRETWNDSKSILGHPLEEGRLGDRVGEEEV